MADAMLEVIQKERATDYGIEVYLLQRYMEFKFAIESGSLSKVEDTRTSMNKDISLNDVHVKMCQTTPPPRDLLSLCVDNKQDKIGKYLLSQGIDWDIQVSSKVNTRSFILFVNTGAPTAHYLWTQVLQTEYYVWTQVLRQRIICELRCTDSVLFVNPCAPTAYYLWTQVLQKRIICELRCSGHSIICELRCSNSILFVNSGAPDRVLFVNSGAPTTYYLWTLVLRQRIICELRCYGQSIICELRCSNNVLFVNSGAPDRVLFVNSCDPTTYYLWTQVLQTEYYLWTQVLRTEYYLWTQVLRQRIICELRCSVNVLFVNSGAPDRVLFVNSGAPTAYYLWTQVLRQRIICELRCSDNVLFVNSGAPDRVLFLFSIFEKGCKKSSMQYNTVNTIFRGFRWYQEATKCIDQRNTYVTGEVISKYKNHDFRCQWTAYYQFTSTKIDTNGNKVQYH